MFKTKFNSFRYNHIASLGHYLAALLLSRSHSGGFAGLGLLDILISWISMQCLAHIDVIHLGDLTDGGSISKSTSIATLWDDRTERLQTFAEQLRDRASLLEDS
ncbi:hypothetical protein ATANTOWER_029804 [Ataeniobius toweri]|uniref:Uncharacterized protein n=1 Tax=Ataeniobius toweri TaxID=208326 RepID=A0ABU7AHG0_9TELE|nr:hypothetical protein [Ataeniobius toweri]